LLGLAAEFCYTVITGNEKEIEMTIALIIAITFVAIGVVLRARLPF